LVRITLISYKPGQLFSRRIHSHTFYYRVWVHMTPRRCNWFPCQRSSMWSEE